MVRIIRKIIKIADSRVISLPKDFPEVSYVVVEPSDGKLIIRPLKEVE